MIFWSYSVIIPVVIIFISIFLYRPFSLNRVARGLLVSLIPLVIYILVIYFLEMEEYIDSGWSFFSLSMFFIPYLLAVLIVNFLARVRRNKMNQQKT